MNPVLHLLAWGAAEALSGWSALGTPTVTPGQADPFGGTGAFTIDDNDGAAVEAVYDAFTAKTGRDAHVGVFAEEGSAGVSTVEVWDNDATAIRHAVDLTWTGGVPALSTRSGAGGLLLPISVGGGRYFIRFSAAGIVKGNVHHLRLYGATSAGGSTGSTIYYVHRSVLLNTLDAPVATGGKRPGSSKRRLTSGVWVGWDKGDEYWLRARTRWIPTDDADGQYPASGWDGQGEIAGINTGLESMILQNAATSNPMLFCRDRSDCTSFVTCELAEVSEEPNVGLESNAMRQVDLALHALEPFEGF